MTDAVLEPIKGNFVKKPPPSTEEILLGSLWAENDVVLTFLRRFGCMFARQVVKQLNEITPLLAEQKIRNVCIGLEELGLEDFIEDTGFNGELYLDKNKQSYKAMKYKRYSFFNYFSSLLNKSVYTVIMKGINEGETGDLKGDTFQNGGTLVITKGGEKILLNFVQDSMIDNINTSDILRVLNISQPIKKELVPDTGVFVRPDAEGKKDEKEKLPTVDS